MIEISNAWTTERSYSDSFYRTHVSAFETNPKLVGSSHDCTSSLSAYIWLVVLSILLCLVVRPAGAAPPAAKNVLILHNWAGLPPSWALMKSTVRARVPGRINFYTTSVENPRFDEKAYQESLSETLRGYGGVRLDLVIAATYPVLQFAMQYRDKMFPGVPIVFTDVTSYQEQDILHSVGVTGVISPLGMRETVDLALRLHPDTTSVAVITGVTAWDKYWLSVAHSEVLRHQDKVREIDIIEPEPEGRKILERVAQLPPHAVVLFQLRPDDLVQPALEPIDVLVTIAQRVPTYSAWQGLALTHGGVGGAYRSLPKEAVLNGKLVARVLSGERPENIPFVHDSDLQVHLDWQALQRWHIPESMLPPGAVVENRPPTLWERDRKHIVIAIVLIVAQAILIAALLLLRARKRKAEAVLRESERRFRVMADTTPSLVWMCDPNGRITYLNERRITFTGPDPDAGYGDTWSEYIHPDDLNNVLDNVSKALKNQRPFSKEYRLRRRDGVYRWMFDVASPRVNGDSSFAGFIGSAIDITDQRLAQEALEKISGRLIEAQEKERRRIARELHDDIGQKLALLSIELDQANQDPNKSAAATEQRLIEIREHCMGIASDVHLLSHQLHSSKLDYLGLVSAIRSFCREFARQHEVTVEFADENVKENLPQDISLSLFRVAQEALHNAVKYSGVTQFAVELKGSATEIRLEVRDSGAGFNVEDAKRNGGLGLVSMTERVNMVRGRFRVESRPGEGTKIVAIVPLVPENNVLPAGPGDRQTTNVVEAA